MFNGIVYNQGLIKSFRQGSKYVKGSLVVEIASNIKGQVNVNSDILPHSNAL